MAVKVQLYVLVMMIQTCPVVNGICGDPEPPRLTLGSVTSSSVKINVTFPNFESWNCSDNWRMRLKENDRVKTIKKLRPTGEETSIAVAGLKPCKNYTYQLKLIDINEILTPVSSNELKVSTAVAAPSSPPVNVRQTLRKKRKLKFVWEMPTSDCRCCGDFISSYSYVLSDDNEVVRRNVTVDNYVKIDGLIPYTNYSFKVRASSSGGDSDYSSHVETTTLEGSPPKMRPFESFSLNATTLKVALIPPTPPHGIIIGYHVRYKLSGGNESWTHKYINERSENVDYIEVEPGSTYAMAVRARTSAGYGEWSDEQNVTTKERDPPAFNGADILRFTDVTDTGVTVTWRDWGDTSDLGDGPVAGYKLEYRETDSIEYQSVYVAKNVTSIRVTGLHFGTDYEFKLVVAGDGAFGLPTDIYRVRTDCPAPEAPTLALQSLNEDAVTFLIEFPNIETWKCGNWRVRLRESDTSIKDINIPESNEESEESITVAGLEPCENYTYQLIPMAGDEIFSPGSSNVVGVSTVVTAPSSSPVNIFSTHRSKRKLKFVWEMPTSDCRCCGDFISHYSYVLSEDNEVVRRDVTVENYVVFDELIPYTNYSFKVRASSSGGDSDYSSHVKAITLEDSPTKMSSVEPSPVNATTLKIRWRPPDPPHGIIIGYHIRYRLEDGDERWRSTYINGQENLHYIDVDPDNNYVFQIRARTSVGYGEWSNETVAKTYRGPGPSASVTVIERSKQWIIVKWDRPLITNGVIIKYEISYRTLKSPNGKVLLKNLTVTGASYHVNITSLNPATLYQIQIAGYTSSGRGEVRVFNACTAVMTELRPLKAKQVTVKRSTTNKGFEITLPPLTQEYATNYVIVIRNPIRMEEVLAELNKPNHQITYSLTEEKLKQYSSEDDSNPAILVGVKSTCGEETTIAWSDVIEIPVVVSITGNSLYFVVIVVFVMFSMLFILVAVAWFVRYGYLRDELVQQHITDLQRQNNAYV